jgi:drug/metabolite transporter (DMT)-like permease
MFTCIKYFPVVIVTLVANVAPLLIALLSYFLYRVGLSKQDTGILLISFVGCLVLFTGTLKQGRETEAASSSELIIPSLLLLMIPFNNACINLYLRTMRDLHEVTLGAYIIFALFLVYLPIVVLFYDFAFLSAFTPLDWLLCVVMGISSVLLQVTKAVSIKYEEPARLAVLYYFQPVIQLVLDILFL